MVNQRMIAERAGVSRAAVSFVLNDPSTRKVSAEVKARILDACAALGYSGDARGRRRRICITIDPRYGTLEPYFSRFMAGAAPIAEAAGYSLVVKELAAGTPAEALIVNLNCDGIIAFGTVEAGLARALDHHLPVVLINQRELDSGCDIVGFDDHAGVAALTDLLIAHGHGRIAFVGTAAEAVVTSSASGLQAPSRRLARRLGGYLGTACTRGLQLDDALVMISAKTAELGLRPAHFIEDALDHLLALADPPSAILAYNDIIAASLHGHLAERGLRVPRDLSLVGFDASDSLPGVDLTSVDPGLDEVGRQAVACLLARLDGATMRPPIEILTAPRLIAGATVAPPAAVALKRSSTAT